MPRWAYRDAADPDPVPIPGAMMWSMKRVPRMITRRASAGDAAAIVEVYLASFSATYDFPLAHADDEVRGWVETRVIPGLETWVVEDGGEIVAMLALSGTMLEQLYVHPRRTGEGIGSGLMAVAKERRPEGLELWTFQVNDGARRFYARHGFEEVEWTDGSDNEEREPDVRCVWRPLP